MDDGAWEEACRHTYIDTYIAAVTSAGHGATLCTLLLEETTAGDQASNGTLDAD